MTNHQKASRFESINRPDYILRDIRAEAEKSKLDLSGYETLFIRNATTRREGQLNWQQIDNPSAEGGAIFIADATSPDPDLEDGLGGIYAAMGVSFQIDGVSVMGAQSLDTLTDINHRKKGLFTDLARSAYAAQQDKGVNLVYGFPNGNSCHGFTAKLEWQLLDPVPFLTRPLRTGYLARRVSKKLGWMNIPIPVFGSKSKNGGIITAITKFGSDHDALWNRIKESIGVSIDRTAEYMNWRLKEKPCCDNYKMVALYMNGKLEGEIAWTVEKKHGGKIGYILELLYSPDNPTYGTMLMRFALREMATTGAEVVLAWNDTKSFNSKAHSSVGFFPLPNKLQPIELHWGAVALGSDTLAKRIYDRSAWYISYLDSDTV